MLYPNKYPYISKNYSKGNIDRYPEKYP